MNRMRNVMTISVLALVLAVTGITLAQQSPEAALRSAIETEMTRGLNAAIQQYKKVAETYRRSAPGTAAQALLRMADAYRKLGNSESQKIYELVIREFADQKEAASIARAALNPRGTAAGAGIVTRRVWQGGSNAGSVSPDGRYVSFVDWESGDLALHDVLNGTNRRVTKKNAWTNGDYAMESVISPDGKQVAYLWWSAEKGLPELRLVSFNENGATDPVVLYKNEETTWIAPYSWSPNGKWIAVQVDRPGIVQIGLINVDNGSLQILKSIGWAHSSTLSFSPDGKYLAFDMPADDDSEHDVFALVIDGSREVPAVTREIPVVVDPSSDTVLGWSSDGKNLFFASDRTGSNSMWSRSFVDGAFRSTPQLIKSDIGWPAPLGMSRSGSFYFRLNIGHGHDVWMATMDFKTGQVVNAAVQAADHNLGSNRMAAWSSDGRQLAYVTRASAFTKKDVVSIRSIETGKIRQLNPRLHYLVWPQWAPDGKSLLISGTDRKGRRGLHIVNAETSETKLVESGDNIVAEWSHDGKSLFYVSDDGLAELNLASGTKRTLLRRRIVGLISVSPSGLELACISMNPDTKKLTLTVVPVSGETSRDLHQLPGGVEGNGGTAWTPDGASILFNQGPNDVLMIPTDGGSVKSVNLGVPRPRGIRVQPAGDKLTFYAAGGLALNEVWTMENFLPVLDAKK